MDCGAGRHERTDSRSTSRNGSRDRRLSSPSGDLELRIPKLRAGSFFPSLLEPRRRVDKALWAQVMTAYVTGTSTRKVDDLVRALSCDAGVSNSTVSRIRTEIGVEVDVFRTRRLDHLALRYVYVDATYVTARDDHHIVSRAVVIATGVAADGNREVLGLDVGDSEIAATVLRMASEISSRPILQLYRTMGGRESVTPPFLTGLGGNLEPLCPR